LLNALGPGVGAFGRSAGAARSGPLTPGKARQAAIAPKAKHPPAERVEETAADLDPLARCLALPGMVSAPSAPVAAAGASTMPDPTDARALEDAVRRIAWGGDRRRGVARLELGGNYAGTIVTVRGEGREVALTLEVRPGTDVNRLPERLVERLEARGLTVTHLEIT
jgi:hypothetical protein